MKINDNNLNNQIKLLESQLDKLKIELQNYKSNNNININLTNNNDLIVPLLPEEKIMTIIFKSKDNQIVEHCCLSCKKANLFVRLEEILNNKFPELKKHDTYFEINTKRIKRFQTLEQNKIEDNDIINICLNDA